MEVVKSITVLKLKLKLAEGQADQLQAMAHACRRGRNAGSLNWLLRQNGLPETAKQSERLCKHSKHGDKPKSESAKVYHAIREATPELTATVHSMLANQVDSFLKSRLDWREGKNEDGKRPKRADAILRYDARPPYFTATEIPVRSREAAFVYGDVSSLSFRVMIDGVSVVRLSTASFSGGIRNKLKLLAAGALKLADSKLLERDGEWFWFLPLAEERAAVKADREAVVRAVIPGDDYVGYRDRPFTVEVPDKAGVRWLGDSRYILSQTIRIESARKGAGARYSSGRGKGHGRAKAVEASRHYAYKQANIDCEFCSRLIHSIADEAERHGCGKVVYYEPTLPARTKCWFDVRGVRFNWTGFVVDLENSLHRRGITLEKRMERIKKSPTKQTVSA